MKMRNMSARSDCNDFLDQYSMKIDSSLEESG